MPYNDGTGPLGQGPRTGWRRAPCGFGFGRGFGRGWFGRGFRRRPWTKEEELNALGEEEKALKEELEEIKKEKEALQKGQE